MIRIKGIEHIAICVDDLDAALGTYAGLFGLTVSSRELVASQKTEAVLLPIGATNLELIAPRGNDGLEKFLAKRGPGLHHIAVEVEGLDEALGALRAAGVRLLDQAPRQGARGHRVAFLHPKDTAGVLIELVEPSAHSAAPCGDDATENNEVPPMPSLV